MRIISKKQLAHYVEKIKRKLYKVYDEGDWEEIIKVSRQVDRLLNRLQQININAPAQLRQHE